MNYPANIIRFPGEQAQDDVLLKPGQYQALYVAHQGAPMFQGLKLQVVFQLLEHPAIYLPRWYRVTTYKSRVSAPKRSDIVREIQAVLGRRIRRDQIPVASLAGTPIWVEVATVTRDSRPKPIAPINHYSVISGLIGKA